MSETNGNKKRGEKCVSCGEWVPRPTRVPCVCTDCEPEHDSEFLASDQSINLDIASQHDRRYHGRGAS